MSIIERKRKGFTLVEIVTVMAILGILMLIMAPSFVSYKRMAQFKIIDANAKQITTASMTLSYMERIDADKVDYTANNIKNYTDISSSVTLLDNNYDKKNRGVKLDKIKSLVTKPAEFASGYVTEDITINGVEFKDGSYVVIVYTCPDKVEKYRVYVGGSYAGDIS